MPSAPSCFSWKEFFLCRILCPCYTRLHPGSHGPCPTEQTALELLFPAPTGQSVTLVDVGCGSGHVLAWWIRHGFGERKLIGIEVNPVLAVWNRWRFRHTPQVQILSVDAVLAVSQLPPGPLLCYLFNPFDAFTLRAFLRALRCRQDTGVVDVVYYNSEHASLFFEDPAWHVTPIALPDSCWPALRARLERTTPRKTS